MPNPEMESLKRVLADLLALHREASSDGKFYPSWSYFEGGYPKAGYHYCVYCGAIIRFKDRLNPVVEHDNDCPIPKAKRLLDTLNSEPR